LVVVMYAVEAEGNVVNFTLALSQLALRLSNTCLPGGESLSE
jgi:hypothetical protein